MEAQNNNNFERAWQQAMKGAEVEPRPEIWEEIEARLDASGRNGKRMWLLPIAIAASVLFAMTTAGVYYSAFRDELPSSSITAKLGSPAENSVEKQASDITANSMEGGSIDASEAYANSYDLLSGIQPDAAGDLQDQPETTDVLKDVAPGEWFVFEAPLLAGLYPFNTLSIDRPAEAVFHRIPVLPGPKDLKSDQLWAGLNLSGGSVTSTAGSVSSLQVADFENNSGSIMVGRTETNTTGTLMNVGLGLGKRISRRWVIQGGLNYSQRTAGGTSNLVSGPENQQSVALDVRQYQGNAQLSVTQPYDVEHRIGYVSIPVQVGYVLLDKKVDVTLLGGMSNDILMQHRVSDSEGNLGSTNLDEDSNFKKYAVSALVSAEVSYPLGRHYTVSAYPQIRQYLSAVQKDVNDSPPVSLEMGFRLSYVF
ncbi:outer membrane beta-barrel protein [Fulvivirga sedimenti]|uniref:PorT family protein n=1 Tax=Fulvivirga sedimenti TaxID=2879465 RepID=A0A9X1KWN5_9BACT|nr:outer membrane beta-barrel protein [Fulvivirga sedimenti]MCA6074936.1 PorT family protein [Fulvivirga sedimenti]MCA6076113.1 PorT family protein [Fulvivirga sedimenti]MCA6077241.1 PorT family protein [Fulvivirga sedimenti]